MEADKQLGADERIVPETRKPPRRPLGQGRQWFILVGGLLLLATGLVQADGSLTLAWDYETEDELAGFRIYSGFTSGFYALTNEAGLVAGASISNLLEGETYYFAVSSFDLSGRESDRSNEIAYTVPVSSTNNVPTVTTLFVETDEDLPLLLPLSGTNHLVAQPPMHGKVSGSVPDVRYIPDADFSGPDSFQLFSFDGSSVVTKFNFFVNVKPVNDPPWTAGKTVMTLMDVEVPIHLVAGDTEGDPLQYVLEAQPAFGSLVGTPPDLRYHPASGFEGQDSFTYRVSDGQFGSGIATVSISVLTVDRIPIVEEPEFFIAEDDPIAFLLNSCLPYRSSVLTHALVPPLHGTLTAVPPQVDYVEYKPAPNFNGIDFVALLIRQSDTELGLAKMRFVIAPVNDPPDAQDAFLLSVEDTPISLELTGGDAEGDQLNYQVVGLPVHGTLSGSPPNLVYLPMANYNGFDQLTFRADDGTGVSGEGIVTILVVPGNDAPAAIDQSVDTFENHPATIVLGGVDVDGDVLRYEIVTAPEHGVLIGEAPNLSYIPASSYRGSDRFTFKVKDASAESEPALVAINVFPAPQITTTTLNGSNLTLNWSSLPGRTYRVFFSDSLTNPVWRVVSDPIIATGPSTAWTHAGREPASIGFYLVETVVP